MGGLIKLLILEDNFADAELIKRELRKNGFDFTAETAQDRRSFLDVLDRFRPDIIIADYSLPEFDGLSAMTLARERFPFIPLVIVSGAIGEETAIEALKAGATDYVLKQRLKRLGPVMRRALDEARNADERRRAEEEVAKLNAELEVNIARLEEANVELEAFNYSLAHDLSTPLRVIDGFAKMLEKRYSDKLDEEGKEFIGTIRGNAQKMGELISSLLHLARLGRHEITKTAIDMAGLARSVSEELKTAVPERRLEFKIRELPAATGERTLIHLVFFNLMANAVKFTGPRKKAAIEVGGYCIENENVYYVKDNGVGFDMKHVGNIFGVFKRLHTEKEFEGTGAGLAIVRRVVQRHGGRVWAEGAVSKGATFYFSLPK